MDSIFGIGAPELLVILLLAGIVMGPQRIRQVALWLGRTTAQLQAISRTFARQLNAELDSIDESGDIKGSMDDIKELRQQLQDLRREVISIGSQPAIEAQAALKEVQDSLPSISNRIQPPRQPDGNGQETAVSAEKTAEPTPPTLPNPVSIPDDPEA